MICTTAAFACQGYIVLTRGMVPPDLTHIGCTLSFWWMTKTLSSSCQYLSYVSLLVCIRINSVHLLCFSSSCMLVIFCYQKQNFSFLFLCILWAWWRIVTRPTCRWHTYVLYWCGWYARCFRKKMDSYSSDSTKLAQYQWFWYKNAI